MAKIRASLLSFCQSTHKIQMGSEEKADDDQTKNQITLITKMCRLKIAQKNLNMNLNIHVMIHRM